MPPVNTAWYLGHDQKLSGQGGHAIGASTGSTATDIALFDPNYGLFTYDARDTYTADLQAAFALYMNQTWGRAVMRIV